MHSCLMFFPFLRWLTFCSGCFRQVFFIWGTKEVVADRVRQVVVLCSYDCIEICLGELTIGRLRRVAVCQRWSFEQV